MLRDAFFSQNQVMDFTGIGGVDSILAGIVLQEGQTFDRFVTEEVTQFVRPDFNLPRSDLVQQYYYKHQYYFHLRTLACIKNTDYFIIGIINAYALYLSIFFCFFCTRLLETFREAGIMASEASMPTGSTVAWMYHADGTCLQKASLRTTGISSPGCTTTQMTLNCLLEGLQKSLSGMELWGQPSVASWKMCLSS